MTVDARNIDDWDVAILPPLQNALRREETRYRVRLECGAYFVGPRRVQSPARAFWLRRSFDSAMRKGMRELRRHEKVLAKRNARNGVEFVFSGTADDDEDYD